jgi:hypothetical protein
VFKRAFSYKIYIGKNNKNLNFYSANENSEVGFMGVETNGGFEFQPGAWIRGNFRHPAPYMPIV